MTEAARERSRWVETFGEGPREVEVGLRYHLWTSRVAIRPVLCTNTSGFPVA